jgi:hypothetical protein
LLTISSPTRVDAVERGATSERAEHERLRRLGDVDEVKPDPEPGDGGEVPRRRPRLVRALRPAVLEEDGDAVRPDLARIGW